MLRIISAPTTLCELLSNMSQIDCPTPNIRTELEPFTSCVISLVKYRSTKGILIVDTLTCYKVLVSATYLC